MPDVSNFPHPYPSVVGPMLGLMITTLAHLGVISPDPDRTLLLIRYMLDHASLILGVAGRVAAARRIKA